MSRTSNSNKNGLAVVKGGGGAGSTRGVGLYQRSLQVLDKEGYAATTLLQKRLKIGYVRASRIIDELEARGVIGAADGLRPRWINTAGLAADLKGDHEIDWKAEDEVKPQKPAKTIAKPDKPASLSEVIFSEMPEIHARRVKVQRMRYVEKVTPREIAEKLHEQLRTIYRDLEAIRKANEEFVKENGGIKQKTLDVYTTLQVSYEERQRRRWKAYDDSADEAVMRRILNDIRDDELRHIELMQSMGVIDKVADKLEVSTTAETWKEKIARLKGERKAALLELEESKAENEKS